MRKEQTGSFDPEYHIPWNENIHKENSYTEKEIVSHNEVLNNKQIQNDTFFNDDYDDNSMFSLLFDYDSDEDQYFSQRHNDNNIFQTDTESDTKPDFKNHTDKSFHNNDNTINSSNENPTPGIVKSNDSNRKIELSSEDAMFQKFFYQIFTTKKRFKKEIVKKIHNAICVHINLPKMTREEFRSIDLYFKNYSNKKELILLYLHQHKEELLRLAPEVMSPN